MHKCIPCLVGAVLLAPVVGAQGPRPLKFGAPSEFSGMDFSRIVDARELSDGRVLVTDAIEKQLFAVNFATGTAAKVGRVGAGPGEYRAAGRLLALPADTTLLLDNAGGRWLVLVRDSAVGIIPASDVATAGGRAPFGADSRGHLLGMKAIRSLDGAVGTVNIANDSSWLVRVTRKTGALDSVAKYRIRPSRVAIQGTAESPTSISVTMNPISTGEQGVIFADGAIAVARLDPYRVDWFIGGRPIAGRPLPFAAIPLTREEKVAVLARLPRSDDATPRDPDAVNDWPTVIPPFPVNGVLAGSDGNVWIRRTPSLRAPATDYDVVNRTGGLVGRVHLPPNESIVTFGRGSIYVVAVDDDGLHHLKRYPLPR